MIDKSVVGFTMHWNTANTYHIVASFSSLSHSSVLESRSEVVRVCADAEEGKKQYECLCEEAFQNMVRFVGFANNY